MSDDMITEGIDHMMDKHLPEKTVKIAMKGLTDFEFGDAPEDEDAATERTFVTWPVSTENDVKDG